eukprot:c16859_g1_i1.p1 GENE.c16859_g1_i1~~c16859_g1_i1.p1  ORF type:complete len:158 (+),score=66.33 c16859_g1_i1:19-492(+)
MSGGLFEFGKVFLQALSSVFAKKITAHAKTHPAFRQGCVNGGRLINNSYVRMNHFLSGSKGKLKIKPLAEDKAIELGAEILSEGIVIGIALVLVSTEVHLLRRGKQEKKLLKEEENAKLEQRFIQVNSEIEVMKNEIVTLKSIIQQKQTEEEQKKVA